jgi:hypothetical protein
MPEHTTSQLKDKIPTCLPTVNPPNRAELAEITPVPGHPHAGFTVQADASSAQSNLTNSVLAQDISGFLPGLPGGLLFFRCHDRFLFIFPVTSTFFRHNGSPDS